MATLPNKTVWLRRGAFAAGLIAALTLVLIGRLPASGDPLGLDATLTTEPTGELAVAPVGRVASATGLRPGSGQLEAHAVLQSQVDARLSLRVRMRPSMADADAALRVRVTVAGTPLYVGPAGGLRSASAATVVLSPRASVQVDVRGWLPADAADGWRGRSITLPLEYLASVDGKARR